MFRALVFKIALVVVLLDQISKILAVAFLENKPVIKLIGEYLQFSFTRNPGAAFSMGTSATLIFTIFSTAVSIYIISKAKLIDHKIWAITAGGFLGGALGNLIDRIFRAPDIFRGHVVDFIMFPNFPLFNLADSAVTTSAVVAVLLSIRGVDYRVEK